MKTLREMQEYVFFLLKIKRYIYLKIQR
ncbi:hypothetical protein CN384_25670 [Bacillus thuringiensis]|nr:hypothetical protein CN384_25670 [Bacillus thuringiensis]PFA84022.1 hypothetical protein CN400_16580 [Bacillus thuringiensis]PFF00470.1 hypothetical protein CN321_01140 [Bacillus thuringiensis]PGN16850.1 hypothetical protein CN951_25020 [Bacillus thuringiensis]PGX90349.1 hypothetical protein COE39_27505 [Bacillus thuringiensis]